MRTPKPKDKVYIKTIPAYARGNTKSLYCIVDSELLGTVFVHPRRYPDKQFDVNVDDIDFLEGEKQKPIKPRTKLTPSEQDMIVRRLLAPQMLTIPGQLNKEKLNVRKLFKEYNDVDFWLDFDPGFQVKSLSWWLRGGMFKLKDFWDKRETRESIEKMEIVIDKIAKNSNNTIQVEDEKVGEDYVFVKKPKNLIDKLN